jgi:hypothetical protein
MLRRKLPEHPNTFFQREQRVLFRIDQHRHDQLIEDLAPTLNEIKVPVRHGIEAAGIDGDDVFQEAPRQQPYPDSICRSRPEQS